MVERIGPKTTALDLERELEAKADEDKVSEEEQLHRVSVFAFDEFERRIQQANVYSSLGKPVEASAELDAARQYLHEVKDKKLRDELTIRLNQARAAVRV